MKNVLRFLALIFAVITVLSTAGCSILWDRLNENANVTENEEETTTPPVPVNLTVEWEGYRNFTDALTADKAAEIIGYSPHTILSYIRQKLIFAVWISGKYILPKTALVDFLVDDFAFEIVHKSTWHMNTILTFTKKNKPNYTNEDDF